jgi:hypothetical protein
MNTKSNKQKGRLGQNEIRDALRAAFPVLEPNDILGTEMGQSGSDLKLSPRARKLIPISPEIKRRKSGLKTVYDWYDQAKAGGTLAPTVFFRQDRSRWLVVIDLDEYIRLLNKGVQ